MKNEEFMLKMKVASNNGFGTIDYTIYNNILKYADEINNLTLNDFAKLCFTSKPSILKFCNKVGLSGYSELKFHIKNSSNIKETINKEFTVVKKYSETNDFRHKFSDLSKEYIDKLSEEFYKSKEVIDDLMDHIIESDIVYIFCANLAYFASKNFIQKLRWLNKHVILENDINVIEGYINQMPKKSATILISLSGMNPHIMQISNWIDSDQYVFPIVGENWKSNNNAKEQRFLIPQIENDLWDNYSIRANYVQFFFDLLYMELSVRLTKVK